MIPTATYYRMSTDEQVASIDSQRSAVVPRAKGDGFKVVREYTDQGISGDDTGKRTGFQRMIEDASKGLFKAIWCWDQDRFGRFDSLEAGYWIHPLRKAGIKLYTVTDGPVNWDDFTGRVMYSIKQEGKHQYLRDLSKNVMREMAKMAQEGLWVCGPPPLGYVVGDDHRLRLGDLRDVAAVRFLYDGYLAGQSLRTLAETINHKGYRTGRGKAFEYVGIRFILKNRNYTGDFHWNLRTASKYNTLKRGEIKPATRHKIGNQDTDRGDWIVVKETHPPIVTHAEFERVQARLEKQKAASTPRKAGGKFILSGLLRCAQCGEAMTGATFGDNLYYLCSGYFHRGAAFCSRNAVRQDELVEAVVGLIETTYLTPAAIKAARQAIVELAGSTPKDTLPAQLAAVRRDLATAERNMALAGSDALRHRYEKIVGELAEREAELSAIKLPTMATMREQFDAAIDQLKSLRAMMTACEPMQLREFLHQSVKRIHVEVRDEMRMKRKRFFLSGGTVEMDESLNLLGEDHNSKQVLRFRVG